jgi:adenylate kinase family enzyme
LAQQIALHFGIPLIELDALNWRPGWQALSVTDPAQFLADVDATTSAAEWVVAGNYTMARHVVWARATHLVWLDYPKHVVMGRVMQRSFRRAWRREMVWGGNREEFRAWRDPGHPVRWAWRTWQSNRTTTAAELADAASAHLKVVQVMRPQDAGRVIEWLISSTVTRPDTAR